MKRHHGVSIFLTLVFGLAFHLSAQTSIGLKVGLSSASRSSSAHLSYPRDISYRTGFIVGGIIQQDLGDILSLLMEPMYIEKGGKSTISLGGTQVITWMPNYFEIPLSIKARFLDGPLKPYALAGPFISILISAKGENEIDGRTITRDDKGDTRPMELGFQAGIGGQYAISQSASMLADVRYSKGLSKVLEEPQDQSVRSYGFQFTVGLIFTP